MFAFDEVLENGDQGPCVDPEPKILEDRPQTVTLWGHTTYSQTRRTQDPEPKYSISIAISLDIKHKMIDGWKT